MGTGVDEASSVAVEVDGGMSKSEVSKASACPDVLQSANPSWRESLLRSRVWSSLVESIELVGRVVVSTGSSAGLRSLSCVLLVSGASSLVESLGEGEVVESSTEISVEGNCSPTTSCAILLSAAMSSVDPEISSGPGEERLARSEGAL